jgi:hypothetical protein
MADSGVLVLERVVRRCSAWMDDRMAPVDTISV